MVSVFSGDGQWRTVEIPASGATVTLGRDPSAELPLADPERMISRRHVALRCHGDGVELEVLSTTGVVETATGVVHPGMRTRLAVGDRFVFGAYTATISHGEAANSPPTRSSGPDPVAPPSDRVTEHASRNAFYTEVLADDPFEDWDDPLFETEPSLASEPHASDGHAESSAGTAPEPTWSAFARGLRASRLDHLDPSRAEALGTAIGALLDHLAALARAQSDFSHRLAGAESAGTDLDAFPADAGGLLERLLGALAPLAGAPEQGDADLTRTLGQLQRHFNGVRSGLEAILDGTLAEFSPEVVLETSRPQGVFSRLKSPSRWQHYCERHQKLLGHRDEWRAYMLTKYFCDAYFSVRSTDRRAAPSHSTGQDESS